MRLDQTEVDDVNPGPPMLLEDNTALLDSLNAAKTEIESLRDQLTTLSDRRSEWMAMLSHELKTPLSLISGYGRLMLSGEAGPMTAKQELYLTESAKGCRRLDGLIRKMLDVVDEKSVKDSLELDFHETDEWVSNVLTMMAPIFESAGVHLVLDIERDLPKCQIDLLRAEQVLTNLLQNAVRVSKPGGVLKVVARKLETCATAAVEVSVLDEGPGVERQDRQRIFEPFVQLDLPERQYGLGLGLAICRRIVDAHGGQLGVDRAPGGGSRFFFALPVIAGSIEME